MNTFHTHSWDGTAAGISALRDALRERAVVHLRGVPAGEPLLAFYSELLARLGVPELRGEDLEGRSFPAGEWLDIRYDPARAGSFRHSNTRQPLHTDGSYIDSFDYDVVVLVCEQAAGYGGATHFIDADTLTALLALEEPDLLADLQAHEVIFSKDGMGSLTRRIIERHGQGWRLNWNAFRIASENSASVRAMAERFHRFLEDRIVDAGLVRDLCLEPGEALFFHDRRVLHGRRAFFGARCLHKGTLRL